MEKRKVFKISTLKKIGKIAEKIIWWIAITQFAANMVIFTVFDILKIAGMIEYVPGYMKVEQYFTVTAIITIMIVGKQLDKQKNETDKIMKAVQINDNNWKTRFAAEMMKSIHFFREQGQLSMIQEAKFREMVRYSVGKMEDEMQEDRR